MYLNNGICQLNKKLMYIDHTKPRKTVKPDLLSKYKIRNKDIAKWFGYKSPNSFNGSRAKLAMLKGIAKIIEHIESTINP